MSDADVNRNLFFDALDDLAGGGDFDPLPDAWYRMSVTCKEIKLSSKGAYMARLEFVVIDDADGNDGRKLWENAMLEGVDKTGKSQTFFLARLLKGLAAEYGRDTAMEFVPFPHWDAEHRVCVVPRDFEGNADLTEWNYWFERLSQYSLACHVIQKTGQTKGSDGKWYDDVNAPKQNSIKEFASEKK